MWQKAGILHGFLEVPHLYFIVLQRILASVEKLSLGGLISAAGKTLLPKGVV